MTSDRAFQVFRGSATYLSPSPRPAVTIGNFDGVHRGHRSLLEAVMGEAAARGVPSCVYTFDPAPRDVLRPDNDIPRIQSLDDKLARLAALGIDHVVVEPFDRAFAANEASWFATEILGTRLAASAVVVGHDFRFGRGRSGNAEGLQQWLEAPVSQVSAFVDGAGEVVSSSRVRQLVRAGSVADAAVLLERPHEVVGTVVTGDRRGRTLGFPTANVAPETDLIPALGVYAVRAEIDGEWRDGVANVGVRPTFGTDNALQVEVHLLDFDGDLYGRRVRVAFVDHIRAEQAFDSLDALVTRIRADADTAARLLA